MADRTKEHMRTDRRLLERPGWITKAELEQELAALPDVSDKIDPREDDPAGESESSEIAAPVSESRLSDVSFSSRPDGMSGSAEASSPSSPETSAPAAYSSPGSPVDPSRDPHSDGGSGEGGGGGFSPSH